MSTDQLKCPKCGGAMEEGYFLDHSVGGAGQPRWGKGSPNARLPTALCHLAGFVLS